MSGSPETAIPDLVSRARARVARAITLLERPDAAALEQATAELTEAVSGVEQIGSLAADAEAETRRAAKAEITALREDLATARLLFGHAWEFRARSTGQAGYSPAGELTVRTGAISRWAFEA